MKPTINLICLLALASLFFSSCKKEDYKPMLVDILGEYVGPSTHVEHQSIYHWDSIQGLHNEWVLNTVNVSADTVVVYQIDENHVQFSLKSQGGDIWGNTFVFEPSATGKYEFKAIDSNYYTSRRATVNIDVSKGYLKLNMGRSGLYDPGEYTIFEGWKK
ncbi:MAG: hypothetical protein IPN33_08560 [Saprospiraceae bacterium]|nr:hypothetical protein [Saprospiraceae bacterium]